MNDSSISISSFHVSFNFRNSFTNSSSMRIHKSYIMPAICTHNYFYMHSKTSVAWINFGVYLENYRLRIVGRFVWIFIYDKVQVPTCHWSGWEVWVNPDSHWFRQTIFYLVFLNHHTRCYSLPNKVMHIFNSFSIFSIFCFWNDIIEMYFSILISCTSI